LFGYCEFFICAVIELEQVHAENRLLDDPRIRLYRPQRYSR
jgi:hypothetical protein